MDIDVERLVAEFLWPALFAALGLFAWLAIVGHRAEKARGLIGLCREAVLLREGQERLKAAGRPAPHLDRTRKLEGDIRSLLRHYGLEASTAAVEDPKPAARPAAAARR